MPDEGHCRVCNDQILNYCAEKMRAYAYVNRGK
jgi:hypothetical protein